MQTLRIAVCAGLALTETWVVKMRILRVPRLLAAGYPASAITRFAVPSTFPTAVILPSLTPTSPRNRGAPVPSIPPTERNP